MSCHLSPIVLKSIQQFRLRKKMTEQQRSCSLLIIFAVSRVNLGCYSVMKILADRDSKLYKQHTYPVFANNRLRRHDGVLELVVFMRLNKTKPPHAMACGICSLHGCTDDW